MAYASTHLTLVTAAYSHGRWLSRLPAVSCGDESLSWGEVDELSNRMAHALLAEGVRKGERIAVLLGNRIETFALYLGIWKAGAVAVPVSTLSSAEALVAIVADCQPTVLVFDAENEDLVRSTSAQLRASSTRLWSLSQAPLVPGATSLTQLLSQALVGAAPVTPLPDDDCTIVYTSGTTGQPKGVVHTHAARMAFANVRSLIWKMGRGDCLLTSTPLYHNGAMLMLMPALINGGHLVVMKRFDEDEFFRLVVKKQVGFTFVVPTQVSRLLKCAGFSELAGSELRKMVCAGSPLPEVEKFAALKVLGSRFTELYGGTEGFGTTIDGDEMLERPGSVGIPAIGGDIRILGEDDQVLEPGKVGEIVGRSPYLMREYFRRPEETEASKWRSPEGEEYFRSGDLGRLDSDGYLYVVGRKKDMLISGGVNVYPIDLEAVLLTHPLVEQAAVVGVPHESWGEVPAAAVVLRVPGGITEDELRDWANARLSKHSRIRHLAVRQELPRNVLGKVVKRELAEEFAFMSDASKT